MRFFKRPQIQDPSLRRLYAKTKAEEEAKLRNQAHVAEIEKIKARARADAQRAAVPAGIRAVRTASSIYGTVGKYVKKMDTDKFESFVTGVSLDKKKKPI